ncbi:hypothetical protein M501DRAFT_674692 [Patellaria atrata CBS 101060]|uniref:Rhodopsin domain-containing protein n=1 Tax=Patellaria atrata CBS 101060 TaxID=1346257 RepID=A0A9P4SCC5_9PEZI|nr:hypothetical protein M501DRAFT_674692 [Patellaria atrata CBS 101060]
MEDRSTQLLVVAIIFLATSYLACLLRVYVRAVMIKSFGWDDRLMVVTLIFYTAFIGGEFVVIRHGLGKHEYNLSSDSVVRARYFWYICEAFYILSTCFVKLSLGLFLLRFAIHRLYIWILRVTVIGTTLVSTTSFFFLLFQCNPASDFWNIGPSAHTCLPARVVLGWVYAASAVNALADWTFGVLPILIVKDLNMDSRNKAVVAGILALGALGSIASIFRLPFVHALRNPDDFLWNSTTFAIWSSIEPGAGIIAGCIATLRPLFHKLLVKSGMSTGSSNEPTQVALLQNKPKDQAKPRLSFGVGVLQPGDLTNTIVSSIEGQNQWKGHRSNDSQEVVVD